MNKDQAISKVNESVASLFTKEDVIKLIEQIETEGLNFNVQDLIDEVTSAIGNVDSSDVMDTSTAEFYLEGNQIQLESIDIDTNYIESEATDAIRDFFDNK